MVGLVSLAPAATAADATGFALLKRSLDGREPALPEGCVHAHYLPHTLRAAHGSWFGFCRAEGDVDASAERVVERFGADFTCPPELRAAFESLAGELVDLGLAHYSQSRLRATASPEARSASEGNRPSTTFRAKVSHSGGKPILFLPTVESVPSRPTGPTRVRLPDGREWVFRFVKVACNVAHPADAASARGKNALPALLRDWFGPDAGLPGTNFEVEFTSIEDGQWLATPTKSPGRKPGDSGSEPPPNHQRPSTAPPLPLLPAPPPAARYTTHVPVYDLTAEIVLSEAAKGDTNAAGRRLEAMKDVVVLDSSETVDLIAEWLTGRGLVPVEAAADAFHIGNAIVHETDYLLTWNCTHIANPTTRPKIEECLRREGMHVPTICTPEELVRWNHD